MLREGTDFGDQTTLKAFAAARPTRLLSAVTVRLVMVSVGDRTAGASGEVGGTPAPIGEMPAWRVELLRAWGR